MRVLLTGVTGYVGGEVLHALTSSTSAALKIACLIRDQTKARQVQAQYPQVETILGDLDDESLITHQAEASDIVLHLAATGHVSSTNSIVRGLHQRFDKTKSPSYWMQISGATCFAGEEIASGRVGFPTDVVYDDIKDKSKILSVLRNNPKRVVENIILAQDPSKVKTALIIGPLIYGPGRGPVNQRSIQAPEIVKATLKMGHGFQLNAGRNIWSNVHVQDLSSLISLLVTAALGGRDGTWNGDGVYNVEDGELAFGDLNARFANEAQAQGLIKSNELKIIGAADADELSGHASILWGTNARTRASKARHELKWKPVGQSLIETIPDLVRSEAENLKTDLKSQL